MAIVRYRPDQHAALLSLYRQLHPAASRPDAALDPLLAPAQSGNGRCWTITTAQDQIAGFAVVAPVLGLPDLFDLDGGVAPSYRRQGYATRLLHHLLQDLHPLPARQLSHCVTGLDTPGARFLLQHRFVVTHEEWVLQHHDLPSPHLPLAPSPPAPCHIAPMPNRREAIRAFNTLYTRSFGPTPWHQPYTESEIDATLQQPQDLLFLWQSGVPIGFVWLHLQGEVGEIEPFGIVPEHQGRGYGRYLLTTALHHLARRDAKTAKIGAWRRNQAALHLYRQLGFRQIEALYYLTRHFE